MFYNEEGPRKESYCWFKSSEESYSSCSPSYKSNMCRHIGKVDKLPVFGENKRVILPTEFT